MRRLECVGDVDEAFVAAQVRGQVFGIRAAGLVERLPDGDPEPRRGQTGRQPVDRHDAARVEHRTVGVHGLELRVVDRQVAPEPLEPARHDDLLTRVEATLDEPPTEPGRLDLTGLVAQASDRPLDATSPRGLDADVLDPHPRRHDGPLLRPHEIPEVRELAQVVVSPGQMEQQVPDVVPAEADARPPQERCRAQTGPGERRRQQLDRVGRGRWCLRRPRRRGAPRHAAATRPR